MAVVSRAQTKTNRSTVSGPQRQMLQMSLFSFVAATVGTVVGFIAAVAVALPMIHQDLAAQTSLLGARLASSVSSAAPASSCVQPTTSGVVLGAATVGGGNGGGMPVQQPAGGVGGGNTFIQKLIGGQLATTTATISDTGPNSDNKIITENTSITHVENTNNVSISNSNDQNASSGSAEVERNTNAGDAMSGDAANANTTTLGVTITN